MRGWPTLVLCLILTAPACARGGAEKEEDTPAPNDSPVRVEVTNDYALPVDIYAVGSGVNQRLGTVHPGMSGQFPIPQNVVSGGTAELRAEASGARQPFRSGPLILAPGTIIEFRVMPQLFNSTVTLRQ